MSIWKNIMLDYWSQLLEISSTQKWAQTSEYRVLDARWWNHYSICNQKPKYVFIRRLMEHYWISFVFKRNCILLSTSLILFLATNKQQEVQLTFFQFRFLFLSFLVSFYFGFGIRFEFRFERDLNTKLISKII